VLRGVSKGHFALDNTAPSAIVWCGIVPHRWVNWMAWKSEKEEDRLFKALTCRRKS